MLVMANTYLTKNKGKELRHGGSLWATSAFSMTIDICTMTYKPSVNAKNTTSGLKLASQDAAAKGTMEHEAHNTIIQS